MGQEIGRANGRSPLCGHSPLTPSTLSLGGVLLALGHDFGTENRASKTLSSTRAKPCHRLFTFFLLPVSTTYAPRPLLAPHLSRILVRGPESEISEGEATYSCQPLPPAFFSTLGNAAMSHDSEDLIIKRKTPIAAPLDCQTTAKRRNLLDSLRLGRLLAPPGRFFFSSRPMDMVPSSPRSHPLTARRRCLTHSLFQERGRPASLSTTRKNETNPIPCNPFAINGLRLVLVSPARSSPT